MLVDREIRHAIECGEIGLAPFDPELLQPASIDLRLGRQLRLYKQQTPLFVLDPARIEPRATFVVDIPEQRGFDLPPGRFVLGTTIERIRIPSRMVARLEGKSSLGRLGLLVHATAGFFDPGFEGDGTLELYNCNAFPIRLRYGMRIAQMSFDRTSNRPDRPYGSEGLGSHYQGQTGPTPPERLE